MKETQKATKGEKTTPRKYAGKKKKRKKKARDETLMLDAKAKKNKNKHKTALLFYVPSTSTSTSCGFESLGPNKQLNSFPLCYKCEE